MANSIPVGHMRVNPHTYMQEVWDGKQWNRIDDPGVFTTIPVHNGGSITTAQTNGTVSIGASKLTENAKEEVYEFLKKNLRVAEYLDENGKVDYVQLELREGEGCIWENIQRVRIK